MSDVQKEIIQYNVSLRRSAKITNIYITSSISTNINKSFECKKILEIGSFTGFSALSMAMALPTDGTLISLDKNLEFSNKAKLFMKS